MLGKHILFFCVSGFLLSGNGCKSRLPEDTGELRSNIESSQVNCDNVQFSSNLKPIVKQNLEAVLRNPLDSIEKIRLKIRPSPSDTYFLLIHPITKQKTGFDATGFSYATDSIVKSLGSSNYYIGFDKFDVKNLTTVPKGQYLEMRLVASNGNQHQRTLFYSNDFINEHLIVANLKCDH